MIRCVQGNIGGGKTYHTMSTFIIPWLSDVNIKCIVTNITGLDKRRIEALHGGGENFDITKLKVIDDSEVKLFWKMGLEKQTAFVIDEIQNFYGSSNYKENADTREELKVFLTKCRHQGHSVVYICQVPTMVHQDILKLTEEFISCAKLNFIKFMPATKYTYIHRNTYKNDAKSVLVQGIGTYKPKVYLCYQSTDNGVKETATKRKGMFPIAPFLALGSLFILFTIIKWIWFKGPEKPKNEQTTQQTIQQTIKTKEQSNECPKKQADGWSSDGSLVYWLHGAQPIGVSVDSGRRSGVIRMVDGCEITVEALDLVKRFEPYQGSGVGPAGGGAEIGATPPPSSTLPNIGGR